VAAMHRSSTVCILLVLNIQPDSGIVPVCPIPI
jgi:hypothetical protein